MSWGPEGNMCVNEANIVLGLNYKANMQLVTKKF